MAVILAIPVLALAADQPSAKPEKEREAQGKKLVGQICVLCHEIERVQKQHFTKEEWAGWIKGMIAEGAPVTDEEFSAIVDYLAKNYGVKE
jgi:cytochrome c5